MSKFILDRCKPVSYTHLDVYKRQQEEDSAEVNEMVRTAKVTPEQLAALLRQSATTTPTPAALLSLITHLDVYKRQFEARCRTSLPTPSVWLFSCMEDLSLIHI